jgi:hypothetical protein
MLVLGTATNSRRQKEKLLLIVEKKVDIYFPDNGRNLFSGTINVAADACFI